MKYVFVIIFFLGICNNAVSQEIDLKTYSVKGSIKDSLNQPVSYAQILVQSEQGSIINYTLSDSLGNYKISYSSNEDSVILMVSRIGFSSQLIIISTNIKQYNFSLKTASESFLKEIIVTDRNPIEARQDTINYLASAFTDGTEINAEDVLEKLPGISVNKSTGKISYQGKEIKKILLDGDDLTDNNYKILSKNLSADWLNEVEVLKHFTESRLLHGIEQSEDIAINLKLKERAKAPLFGTIMLGGGIKSKYTFKSELLSYSNKIKLFTVGVANNTGFDLETYDLNTYSNSQIKYTSFLFPEKILNNELFAPDFFKTENFTFHEGQFISNSMVIKPSSKINIRSTTTIYNNRLNYIFSDSLSYFLPVGLNFAVNQKQIQIQKPQELFQDIKYNYQLSEKEDLQLRLQFKIAEHRLSSLNRTDIINNQENDNNEQQEIYSTLSYTNRLSSNWVLTSDLLLGFNKLKENLLLSGNLLTAGNIRQNTEQTYNNLGGIVKFYGRINTTIYTNLLLGWTKTFSEFNVESSFFNNYNTNHVFAEINIKKTFKNVKLYAGNRFSYAYINYNRKKSNKFLFEPVITASYKHKLLNFLDTEFKGVYNIEYNFLTPSSLFNEKLINSFRSTISYSAYPNIPVRNDMLGFSLKASDNEKSYISANIQLGYLKTSNAFATQISYYEDIINNLYIQNSQTNTFFIDYSVDKYFQKINTSIKLSYEAEVNSSYQIIENEFGENLLHQQSLNFIAGTALTRKINISAAYRLFQNQSTWLNNQSSFNYDNYVLKIIYKYSYRLKFIIDCQAVNFGSKFGGFIPVLAINTKYNTKNKKWNFELKLNNIMNIKSVIINYLEPSFFSMSNYPLQPRFILLSAKYKLH
ncbi:MAG: carboxypeptidase-like regulatory domain-containing protein [Bacteroidales bacterium]|nr:carboxypeptidase-like regulatory domain-containing protein [Bacteroidales bacterium]